MLMLYFYLTGGLYIVWRGQLLYICDWGVWRYLGTDIFNSSHAFSILMLNLGIIGTTIIIMKKIIVLSFLLCIPIFMVAQTFKITGVKGIEKSAELIKEKKKRFIGKKITLSNPYPNAILSTSIKLTVGENYNGEILSPQGESNSVYTKQVDEYTIYVLQLNKIYEAISTAELSVINLKDNSRWIYSMSLF